MADQATGGLQAPTQLQAPLSPTPPQMPRMARQAGQPSAQPTGAVEPSTPPPASSAPQLVAVPAVPGIEETDLIGLSEAEKAKLMPILKKAELSVSSRLQGLSEAQRKAAAWDSAMSIPTVNQALTNYLEGRQSQPEGASAKEEPETFSSFEDMTPQKVQEMVAKTVKGALAEAVAPLQQQVSGLFEVVARREMDAQFGNLRQNLPDLDKHRAEITQLIAEDKARSVEDAYDLIQGRMARTRKSTLPREPNPTPEQEAATTVVSPEAGPLASNLSPAKSRGMLEHLRAAAREHGIVIR